VRDDTIDTLTRPAVAFFEDLGETVMLAASVLSWAVRPPLRPAQLLTSLAFIGSGSTFIVVLVGLFTGMAFTVSTIVGFRQFSAEGMVGGVVALAMARELAPVLAAVVVTARAGSTMASELGNMRVTEQIDAMRALGVDPIRKLVTPRIFSTIAMLFFLTILSDAFGIVGGGLVTVLMNHQNGTQYLNMAWEHLSTPDVIQGLMKPIFFGYILSSIGCFYGLRTTGGTQGVGQSTIQAVVTASVFIIFVDFVITRLLLNTIYLWM